MPIHTKKPSSMQPPQSDDPSHSPETAKKAVRYTKLRVVSILFRIVVIVVILSASLGIVAALMATKERPAQNHNPIATIRIRTMTAKSMPIHRSWDGFGTARSMNDADVVAEVAGRVIQRPISVEPGQRISAGTELLSLDSQDYRNALEAANQAASALQAQIDGLNIESERLGSQISLANDEIDAADRDLQRTSQAIQAGAGSAGELDSKTASLRRVQREVESLKQRLELIPSRRAQLISQLAGQRATASAAQNNLDRSILRAPISGILQSVDARAGDWVAKGNPVARIVDLSHLEIPIRLPASAIEWITLGDHVQLWAGDTQGSPDQTGTITRIAPEVDSGSRTISVFVEVKQGDNPRTRLSPGRFVLARVLTPDTVQRIVVPRRAVRGGRVLIAQTDDQGITRVAVRPVSIAYSIDGTIEHLDEDESQWAIVSSGLTQGDRVIVSLLDQLTQGMEVSLIQSDDPVTNTTKPGANP